MGIETVLSSGPAHDIYTEITDATHKAFFEYAKLKAQKGTIIIDTVFDSFDNYDQFLKIFSNYKKTTILVYCPLDVIQEQVEKEKSDRKA